MDTPREWLEVSGPTVDVAVAAAISELGLETPDQVNVEVIQEGKRGVLGLGGREAIVKVSPLPKKRRRRRRRGGSSSDGSGRESASGDKRESGGERDRQRTSTGGGRGGGGQSQRKSSSDRGRSGSGDRDGRKRDGNRGGQGKQRNGRDEQSSKRPAERGDTSEKSRNKNATKEEPMPTADISEQADVAREFLEGLLDAFGLEGAVTTRIDDDVLYLDVAGEQTEALVGAKGVIMTSVLEITRTVVQRKTFGAPRMRLDIAGYAERRRTALTIYAGKLAEQVKDQGNEVMLEPMNPADRKVVHDAVADIDGVRSFSEGEDPHRAVVIAPA